MHDFFVQSCKLTEYGVCDQSIVCLLQYVHLTACSFPVMPISSSWLWRGFRKLWPKPLSSTHTWTVWSLSASVLSHAWLKPVRSSTNTSTVLPLIGTGRGMTFLAHLTFILIGTLQEQDDFYKFYSLIWQLVKAQRNIFQKENSQVWQLVNATCRTINDLILSYNSDS